MRVGSEERQNVCREMQQHFRAGHFEFGAVAGIQAGARHLARYFTAGTDAPRELPEQRAIL